ncbi:MAG: insulinase family protein [Myxococcales bacterium]|nr:insulinase family protein [Myxococcales bacterium]
MTLVAACCWLGAGPAAASEWAAPAAGDPIHVKRAVLDNGLTVLVSENHERPSVFGAVVVRAGGKHDPADATGIAHYLEHMLFKGTQALGTIDYEREAPHIARIEALYEQLRGTEDEAARAELRAEIERASQEAGRYAIPNELDHVLQELGSTGVNAFTSPDITVYHNTFPSSRTSKWLAVYGHRFQQPVFRLFQSELEAVYEEKNRSMDGFDPIAEEFLRHFFRAHPYGRQLVIGSVEHLKNPSLKEMRAFYERYYVPNNMALVLAGDVDAAAILPEIEARFGGWRPRPVEPFPEYRERPFDGREQVTVRMTPVRIAGLGFRLPSESDPDHAAVLVCNELLTNAQEAGLLDQLARDGDVLLTQAVPIPLNDYGVGLVAVVPKILGQSFRGAEGKLLEQFAVLREGRFTDAQFAAARRAVINHYRRMWEDNEERALAMVSAFGRAQPWPDFVAFLERLEGLTREDVSATARRYYGDDYLVMRSRVGFPRSTKLEKPGFKPVKPATSARSVFHHKLATVQDEQVTPRYVDFAGDIDTALVTRGVHVQANHNPFNDLYSLELRFGVGLHHKRGLDVLAAYLGKVGTRRQDARAFKQALWELATELRVQTTHERFIVRLDGPEESLAPALRLLSELLEQPAEDRAALRRVRRETWGLNLVAKRQPTVIADALREYVTFGDDSSYLRVSSPREIAGMSPRGLNAALQDVRGYAVTARYVGARSAADVATLLRENVRFADFHRPAYPRAVRPRVAENVGKVYFVKRRRSVQTQLVMTVEGEVMSPEMRPRAHAFNEYFGGSMAGLVFQEIRELRSLAYSAHGHYVDHPVAGHPGLLLVRVGTQGDKTLEAAREMIRLITAMPERPERVDGLREALVQSQLSAQPGFRQLQGVVDDWRWLGYRQDPRAGWTRAYSQLSFDDVRAFYQRYVASRPVTMMVVGDPRRVSARDLSQFGDVEVVSAGRLFSR